MISDHPRAYQPASLRTSPFLASALPPQDLKLKIDQHYRVNMLLDNLPITVYDLLDAVGAAASSCCSQ